MKEQPRQKTIEYLAKQISAVDNALPGEEQTFFIKRLELGLQLEILRQLERIADQLTVAKEGY